MDVEVIQDIRSQLIKMIVDVDARKALDHIRRWGVKYGYDNLLSHIIEPVLIECGKMWEEGQGTIVLAHNYIISMIVEEVLSEINFQNEDKDYSEKKTGIVIGNIEDDYHYLGRKFIVSFLKSYGWQIHDLGNDVTAKEFVDKSLELDAPLIAVSAMMYSTALNIKKVREEIDSRDLKDKVRLAVGGAIFVLRPELVEEVGGDGTAKNVFLTNDLFKKLNREISEVKNHE